MRSVKRLFPSMLFAMMIAYFGYHALNGEQGVLNWLVVQNQINEMEVELAETRAEREGLEIRAARLRSDSLDLDYVEERATALLNIAHPRDFVVEIEAPEGR
ncbi:septum formation initiator family protein [Hyphobacterium sp. HN65]|uniref:Septum formation initiator family protein n=1 Tax=Hyphobacterium lacteum TaxID=3116575 RepID=A0ABU7LLW6_9PROT|nr:septum formation initiator family protein [Hyphobacterium sp. HN65]MEE2524920.1 septum formation initiator family protein [Hyphobacterium sp. HN65]